MDIDATGLPAPERITVSLSYLCLFAVLVWYKYEIIFRTILLVIAIFGLWCPFLYGVPYFLVAWRVCIGMNVSTERPLFIGRTYQSMDSETDASNTLDHWVVVVQVERRFLYTHAVGEVVLERGIKKDFKSIDEDELRKKYCLIHVGFVTRRNRETKVEEVVDLEPMQSGNTCQEFAVDIAFQLSSSRTYTFMKIMLIPRIRNFIFYTVAALSLILYVAGIPLASWFNVAVIINVFTSIELARIGVHNRPQTTLLPVVRAYYNYPTTENFMLLFSIVVLFSFMYVRLDLDLLEAIFMACIILCIVLIVTYR